MTIKSNKKMYVAILLSVFFTIFLNSTVNAESIPFNITIGGNGGESVSSVNLILGEHDTETLKAKVKDSSLVEIEDASVTWESDNTQVVTVNSSSGMLTAVGEGTAKITATSGDVKDECEVTVYPRLNAASFSQAKYESTLNWTTETLKITGITPSDNYNYIITKDKDEPTITKNKNGALNLEAMKNTIENFIVNEKEKYIYTRSITKYTELSGDLYLWILQQIPLKESSYYDTNGNLVTTSVKFLVKAKKIERAKLPQLNLILQTFSIGKFNSTSDEYTYIRFNFPTVTDKRKFTLKIGKVTDNSILNKIKKNNYVGITDLLSYAKNNKSIYSKNLTTTSPAYFRSDSELFDGKKLLQDKSYYYIYAKFDDESNKYNPIEGVTLGQARILSNGTWYLDAYTSSDFKWDNLSSTDTKDDTTNNKDNTTFKGNLPYTGKNIILFGTIIILITLGVIFYKKSKKYNGID